MRTKPARFPVFHVPHDGDAFPEELMESVCIPREEFLLIHAQMRDVGVRELVPLRRRKPGQTECFPVSRLLCDVERFIGPAEIMERYGMGFCYQRAYDGRVIKRVNDELREKTLVYYRAHHACMDQICRQHRRIALFDLHSYADEIVPRNFLREGCRTADLCIGTDPRYTPEKLADRAATLFRKAGFSVARNEPYSGCYVPNSVLAGESGCDLISVMLEFHRRVYCDARGIPDPEKIGRIRDLIEKLAGESIRMG